MCGLWMRQKMRVELRQRWNERAGRWASHLDRSAALVANSGARIPIALVAAWAFRSEQRKSSIALLSERLNATCACVEHASGANSKHAECWVLSVERVDRSPGLCDHFAQWGGRTKLFHDSDLLSALLRWSVISVSPIKNHLADCSTSER